VYIALGIALLGWLLNTPPGLLGKADAIGYAVCHRIDARSFHIGATQFPLCARCSGMYLGALLGLAYLTLVRPRRGGLPPWRIIFILAILVGAFGVDGINSYLHLFPFGIGAYEPNNTLRLLTGTGMGLVIAAFVFPSFNQTFWQDWDPRPALDGFRHLGALALLGLILDGLVLSGIDWLLYPLALIGAGGVLVILSMVYGMILAIMLGLENRFQRFGQLITPLAAGLLIAIIQIAASDYVRFLLTGTWDGFHLG
jgi:uncharacterized membrane protein